MAYLAPHTILFECPKLAKSPKCPKLAKCPSWLSALSTLSWLNALAKCPNVIYLVSLDRILGGYQEDILQKFEKSKMAAIVNRKLNH